MRPAEALAQSIMNGVNLMKYPRLVIALISMVVLSACTTLPRVNMDYDPNFDFETLKTFYVIPDAVEVLGVPTNPLLDARIRTDIAASLTAKGLTQVSREEADALISFHVTTQDKTRVTSYNNSYGYYGSYGYAPYHRGYMGYPSQSVDVSQYTEGTLIIDIASTKEGKAVWRGVGTRSVRDWTPDELDVVVRQYVDTIFGQIPFE